MSPPDAGQGRGEQERPIIGVLGLQGDVREHRRALVDVGAVARLVRRPSELEDVDGIVLPGGESTTLSLLLGSSGLFEPLAVALDAGLPAFGTCAGLLLLSNEVLDGRPDQRTFHAIDLVARRNAYGRQLDSFEAALPAEALDRALAEVLGTPSWPERGRSLPAVFIRAPAIEATGPLTEVLVESPPSGERTGAPVVARQGRILVSAFHPELTDDRRLHRLFVEMARDGRRGVPDAEGLKGATVSGPDTTR